MYIINAENLVLGRIATFASQKALQGELVAIVNVDKAVVTGTLKAASERYVRKASLRAKGDPEKGPKYQKSPSRIAKNAVKGMLPHQSTRGLRAIRLVKAYEGIPNTFKGKEFTKLDQANIKSGKEYVTLEEVCRKIGWK